MFDLLITVPDLFLEEFIAFELLLQPEEIVCTVVSVERSGDFLFWLSAIEVAVLGQTLGVEIALADILNDLHPSKPVHVLDHYVKPKVQ